MITHPDGNGTADARQGRAREARNFARQAVHGLALEVGAKAITRPMVRDDPDSPTLRDVDPQAGMRAARDVELAARGMARDYVKMARQDGMSWQEIGAALSLTAGTDDYSTIADAAFDFAAGDPDSHYARTYGRSFPWRCPACHGLVSDHGPCNGPVDDEPGHHDGCQRLAATVAAWQAQWADD